MFAIGSLVASESFSGIGKVILINQENETIEVSFFESPLNPDSRISSLSINDVKQAKLHDETVIYCRTEEAPHWQRARYGGERPNSLHLVIYRSKEQSVIDISNIYVLNLNPTKKIDATAFLASRTTDTPHYSSWRSSFVNAYIDQRASCLSISSILNSSVELEAHQIAVVKKVLQDDIKKYVLADEVGLGKTIEAGMILRELILCDPESIAVISVPEPLIPQWKSELRDRFFLSELYDISIYICSHDDLARTLVNISPSITIIDEAHQISPKAWSADAYQLEEFLTIANGIHRSESTLLLSGTPLIGNEKNFLAMLHLLSPEAYLLNEQGIADFHQKIKQREFIGGAYQSLSEDNDNSTLSDVVESLQGMFPDDIKLQNLASSIMPLIDWMADESGEQRALAIKEMKGFLGNNYRLHQRLLRNRRDDPSISVLFPGLDGSQTLTWSVDDYSLSIEQRLHAFKDEFLATNSSTTIITNDNLWEWFEAALISPSHIKNKAINTLANKNTTGTDFEFEELKSIIQIADAEQTMKDNVLHDFICEWLNNNKTGQIVVFCTDCSVANDLFNFTTIKDCYLVERHSREKSPEFISDQSIRLLICDESGEDGLNLHGGQKLVIHYSLPLSISRIEQRLGRVNRYCASISANPIRSIILMPESNSFSRYWHQTLECGINIFNNSVSSLQYVLEAKLKALPSNYIHHGYSAFSQLSEELDGENGWLSREKRKVSTQEQLNNMDVLVASAKGFSESLVKADIKAENQTLEMNKWIINALIFKKEKDEINGVFRFKYIPSRTLMDVKSFIRNCILGLDYEESDHKAPVTHLMTYDRGIAAKGKKISPYRYGQPFLNTIYKSLSSDTRGVSSAHVRLFKGPKAPKACFMFEWLSTHQLSVSSPSKQRVYDQYYPPNIKKFWYFDNGTLISDVNFISLLEKPYEPHDTTKNTQYQDINLRRERWKFIEESYPEKEWQKLVEDVQSISHSKLVEEDLNPPNNEIDRQCISARVVILVDPSRFS